MRLLHLAAGRKHVVWAICDESGGCQVLEMLMKAAAEHADLAEDMMALLLEEVPDAGPPLGDSRKAKRLYRDFLYELKADKGSGRGGRLGLRVAFFFDGPTVVVCTNAFYKSSSTPPDQHKAALDARLTYFEAKERGELEFESLETLH